jgi:hypothetical protein
MSVNLAEQDHLFLGTSAWARKPNARVLKRFTQTAGHTPTIFSITGQISRDEAKLEMGASVNREFFARS